MSASAVPAPSAGADAGLDAAAQRIAALARELAPETERARALPPALVHELRACGLLRACAPAALGAPQAAPALVLRCAETIARGDASAGWCVSIAATSSLLSAYLPAGGTAEVFGDPHAVAAGVWAPTGGATPVDGGVRVSGKWSFCSGISHSDWLFTGCVLADGKADAGMPTLRVVALPTADLQVLDTWHTSGLRGTGSHDALAEDLFVPEHRVLTLLGAAPRLDAPLYRFPVFGFFALSIAAAALGNARGAIDELSELATAKTALGSSRVLAERPATQAAVGAAEASLRAARALFYGAIDEAWTSAQQEAPEQPAGAESAAAESVEAESADAGSAAAAASVRLRLGLRLAATHAVRTSAEVARAMYDLGGGTAIYDSSPLQRRFRDAHTATAHFQVNPSTWELAGRVLLGLPTRTVQL
jgi:alkylation response protein AidB-like acyl-CoA dehydrogenase